MTEPVLPLPAPPPVPPDATAPRKRPAKSSRRRSREIAVQGLYQWLVSACPLAELQAHMREQEGFDKCDQAYLDTLLAGCTADAAALDTVLARHVDRKTSHLSPVEHAILLIGTFELKSCLNVPYRVAINEGVELAKSFGGTDGHKYVNGVLDKAAAELRPGEVRTVRGAPA